MFRLKLLSVPALTQRVTDLTQSLGAQQESDIEQSLAALEQAKGSQVAVLIVESTAPETIEQYATRVFEKWKLGRKSVDDGVLLLIAIADRRMRIEVGYGLEGAIPDIAAGRIINEYIFAEFRKGNYYEGVRLGTDQITGLINGEPLPPAVSEQGSNNDSSQAFFLLIFVSTFL